MALFSGLLSLGLACTFLSLPPALSSEATALKVVSFNVFTGNKKYADVVQFIEVENPDVIFFMEIDDHWLEGLRPLKNLYPYEVRSPREDNFGVVLMSKYPFVQSEVHDVGEYALPEIEARIQKDGKTFLFYGLHTPPPNTEEDSAFRNEQLFAAAERLAGDTGVHAILLGDFNMTHFSPWFGEILRKGRLTDTSAQSGISPTWLRHVPLLAIAIDHVLISENLSLVKRRIGPSLGSDHNMLIVEVGLRQ